MPDDYAEAAVRHYRDAESLAAAGRYDNAGHLVGFAAECAIKNAIRKIERKPNAFIEGHFPEPLIAFRQAVERSRTSGPMLALSRDRAYFRGWSVNDRYLSDDHVTPAQYETWKDSAQKAFRLTQLRYVKIEEIVVDANDNGVSDSDD